MQLNNFIQYIPNDEKKIQNIQYFISDNGIDFYESFEKFKLKYKIGFDKQGIIRTVSEDISAIYPLDLSIVDVASLPDNFDIDGQWIFENGEIKQYIFTLEEVIFFANQQKKTLLDKAAAIIAPYQDAIDLGIATDKELKQLNAWKQYRVDLNRIDTATAPDIAWPEKPQWPINVISGVNKTWKWRQVCRRSPVLFCLCIRLFMASGKRIAQAAISAPPMRLTI
ncbi:tail fiber assembly protein [Providencia rettgeri]|nr:tail fiber assembly protein [Providencia rettgeri]MDM9284006.1 tail fiber assembly protein [Providencia rettgeri]